MSTLDKKTILSNEKEIHKHNKIKINICQAEMGRSSQDKTHKNKINNKNQLLS